MAHPRPDDAEHDEFDDDGTGQQHEGGQGVGGIAEDSLCCTAEQIAARRDGGGGQLSGALAMIIGGAIVVGAAVYFKTGINWGSLAG